MSLEKNLKLFSKMGLPHAADVTMALAPCDAGDAGVLADRCDSAAQRAAGVPRMSPCSCHIDQKLAVRAVATADINGKCIANAHNNTKSGIGISLSVKLAFFGPPNSAIVAQLLIKICVPFTLPSRPW